jgi:16S rRNA (cytosine967-C5)-methyltransferase
VVGVRVRVAGEDLAHDEVLVERGAVRLDSLDLDAGEGELVVDVCACPGGKSFGAALDMRNTGKVFSFDIHPNKLSAIKNGANLLGLTNLAVAERNAETPDEKLLSQADRVIVDVPCSGLGEICAKPEIRKKDPAEFAGLYRTQAAILNASADYVKPGGVLVYSTCTINKKENECRVQAFLACRTDFRLTDEKVFLPTGAACEGFYAARLEKTR